VAPPPPKIQPAAPARQPSKPSLPPKRDDLTETRVIKMMCESAGAHRFPIVDEADLAERLSAVGIRFQRYRQKLVKLRNQGGEELVLNLANFVLKSQRHLLQLHLYPADSKPGTTAERLDCEFIRRQPSILTSLEIPLYGRFWLVAQDICLDPEIRETWGKIIMETAHRNSVDRPAVLMRLMHERHEKTINPWARFVLLQAHCGGTPGLLDWPLSYDVMETNEFKMNQHLLVPPARKQRCR
jgi:hypothetical protein